MSDPTLDVPLVCDSPTASFKPRLDVTLVCDASMCAKDAAMSPKDATMCAKDAAMSAKGAGMCRA